MRPEENRRHYTRSRADPIPHIGLGISPDVGSEIASGIGSDIASNIASKMASDMASDIASDIVDAHVGVAGVHGVIPGYHHHRPRLASAQ